MEVPQPLDYHGLDDGEDIWHSYWASMVDEVVGHRVNKDEEKADKGEWDEKYDSSYTES